jgi:hypothetical protein
MIAPVQQHQISYLPPDICYLLSAIGFPDEHLRDRFPG